MPHAGSRPPDSEPSAVEYGILIIEDDFRIADIHRAFIEQSEGFRVVAMARSGSEARELLAAHAEAIQLVLLDAYLPDVEGLELLWMLRRDYLHMDVVMITAAREVDTISEALRGGVFDYLIKPTEATRMAEMLARFRRERAALAASGEMNQQELDRALARLRPEATSGSESRSLPKGIDRLTLAAVVRAIEQADASLTAMQAARVIGASRSTARRYLEYLVSIQVASAELGYGDVGRPERRYRLTGESVAWLKEG
ncbi:response regulator [Halomonas urumqiensis]|uniref:Transcriptional regulatory protein n=1 Tax=Halomonas urumqiensis TaxID=1684789 RepID=A0A2N7UFP0_9GAMM|nr:response regulator [Halomonas urumqiensis]PMR79278.1 response regulator [Halomonas urumqiensis]PTB03951.1 response regulator [Halomonas urumqiensis]GHE19797.1 two-component system response regulator [Halomonas urumqiensis]